MLEKVQLKAPPRLPESFGQIRETFFLAHVLQWTDSIPECTVVEKAEPNTEVTVVEIVTTAVEKATTEVEKAEPTTEAATVAPSCDP